jgi:hypothetical protein
MAQGFGRTLSDIGDAFGLSSGSGGGGSSYSTTVAVEAVGDPAADDDAFVFDADGGDDGSGGGSDGTSGHGGVDGRGRGGPSSSGVRGPGLVVASARGASSRRYRRSLATAVATTHRDDTPRKNSCTLSIATLSFAPTTTTTTTTE